MGIDFIPYETEKINSQNLALSLLFAKDSFFYGIQDNISQKFQSINKIELPNIESDNYTAFLKEKIKSVASHNKRWASVHVAMFQERFTLVHADHFMVGREDVYIRNVLRTRKGHRAKSRFISGSDYWGIYTLPKLLEDVVINQFPQAAFSHYLIDSITAYNIQSKTDGILLSIIESQILITAIKDGVLQFSNFYTCLNDEEILYYTMLAYKKANLDPNKDPLQLRGLITSENPCYTLLYRYIRDIEFSYKRNNQPFQQSIFKG